MLLFLANTHMEDLECARSYPRLWGTQQGKNWIGRERKEEKEGKEGREGGRKEGSRTSPLY